jgi:predicted permease
MEETFAQQYEEAGARSRFAILSLLVRTTVNVTASGARERIRVARNPATANMKSSRKRGQGMIFDTLRQDLVFAVRSLKRNPTFSLAALLTLALGTGATTSIFSVVNGVLLRPLPYPDQDRLLMVHAASVQEPDGRGSMSGPDILDLAEAEGLETLVGYTGGTATLTGMGEARIIPGARVSEGILSTFGLEPVMGRDIQREETVPGTPGVVVISHGFWQEELGGDPEVLGRTLDLQGDPYEIVGVAPPGFSYPNGSDLWRPYFRSDEDCGRGCHVYSAIGRMDAGITVEQAQDQAEAVAVALEEAYPDQNFEKRFKVRSLEEHVVGDVRAQLWILLGAVGLVLLVACANVANLLLGRAHGRLEEVGVRAALGAGRSRLVQQILTESMVLALAGGILGVGLAFAGVGLLKGMAPEQLPRVEEISVNGTVLIFAFLLSLTVALVFGLSPALRLARSSPAAALGRSRRGGDRGQMGRRSRSLLLASEVALSLVLLVGSGLLLKTLAQLRSIEPGYRTENVMRFVLSLPESAYPELSSVAGFYENLEQRLAALPGVESVGSTFGAPLGNMGATGIAQVEGEPEPAPGEEIPAALRPITPGYLETMGVPLVRGRGIEPSDREGGLEVALLNEALAQELFPEEDPLGQRVNVSVDFGYGSPYRTVVGVVGNEKVYSLTEEPVNAFYVPQRQAGPSFLSVAVRTRPGTGPMVGAVRGQLAAMDPNLPLRSVETMEQVVATELAPTRFFLTLLGVFAILAVSLAAIGLYGVATYLVSRRRQEIGIRIALGARGNRVVGMVLRQAAVPTTLGLVAGLGIAWAGAEVLSRFLFGVEPRDPLVFGATTVFLALVALGATYFPAKRAGRVDPGEALRAE